MKRVTLTFDNGPHLTGTPHVLEVLAQRSLQATFFLVAERLQQPELRALAESAKAQGHRIANHTMTHGVPLGRRHEEGVVQREIADAQTMLGTLTDQLIFRPNGDKGQLGDHLLSIEAVDYLVANKFTAVTWNCVPQDWVPPATAWMDRAADTMQGQDWTLLVLHDHCIEAMQHLGQFLDRLISQGYEFSQDFPEECILIDAGVMRAPLAAAFTT